MMYSVVIPLYNKEKHIERAVYSVLSQTYTNFELLIVDDGSTDLSYEKVCLINDNRIVIIRQKNAGVSKARNVGIENAKYDYVAFLDADDEWRPTFLEEINRLINNFPEAGLFATKYLFINAGEEKAPKCVRKLSEKWFGILEDYFLFARVKPIITSSSVVVPKKILYEIGLFPLHLKNGEDLYVWSQIALRYRIAYSNNVGAFYHQDTMNRSYKNIQIERTFQNFAEKVLLDNLDKEYASTYFIEYMYKMMIVNASNLIKNGDLQIARNELKKVKTTKLNRIYLYKIYLFYILSFILKFWSRFNKLGLEFFKKEKFDE